MFMLGGFASGLVVYWITNNIITFMQQYVIMRSHGHKPDLFGNIKSGFKKKPVPVRTRPRPRRKGQARSGGKDQACRNGQGQEMTARLAHLPPPDQGHGREDLASVCLSAGQAMPWDRVWAVAHEAARSWTRTAAGALR
jgi:hypothetical protein